MLTLTESAVRLLSEVLDRDGASDRAVRIVAGERGWTMRLDREAPEDQSFEYDGRTLLLLGPSVAEALEEKTLDAQGTERGWRLRLE